MNIETKTLFITSDKSEFFSREAAENHEVFLTRLETLKNYIETLPENSRARARNTIADFIKHEIKTTRKKPVLVSGQTNDIVGTGNEEMDSEAA
jgi:hypothetical protein